MSETPTMAEQTKTLKVTQVKSTIGFNKNQFAVLQSLGLRRIRHTVTIADTPETRGHAAQGAAPRDGGRGLKARARG